MLKKIKIYNIDVEYSVDYRNIKYPRLEFKTGKLLLVLPRNYNREVDLIKKYENWIYNKKLIIDFAKKRAKEKKIINRQREEFKKIIFNLADSFSRDIGVKINKIYFKKLKSKWGSCSPRKNITFNILMRYLPIDLLEYIVYHEVLHLIEPNHNKRFWQMIGTKFKDYESKEKDLLVYWFLIQDVVIQNNYHK